jgi:hypothetical protein
MNGFLVFYLVFSVFFGIFNILTDSAITENVSDVPIGDLEYHDTSSTLSFLII